MAEIRCINCGRSIPDNGAKECYQCKKKRLEKLLKKEGGAGSGRYRHRSKGTLDQALTKGTGMDAAGREAWRQKTNDLLDRIEAEKDPAKKAQLNAELMKSFKMREGSGNEYLSDAEEWMESQYNTVDDHSYLVSKAVQKFKISRDEAERIYKKISADRGDNMFEQKIRSTVQEWMGGIGLLGVPAINSICQKCEMPMNACKCAEEDDKGKNLKAKLPKGLKFMKETTKIKRSELKEYIKSIVRETLSKQRQFLDVGSTVSIDSADFANLPDRAKSILKPGVQYKVLHVSDNSDNVLIGDEQGHKALVPGKYISASVVRESDASQQAKQMGLQPAGFGRYKDPKTNKVTHKSSGGKLVPIGKQAQGPASPAASQPGPKAPVQAPVPQPAEPPAGRPPKQKEPTPTRGTSDWGSSIAGQTAMHGKYHSDPDVDSQIKRSHQWSQKAKPDQQDVRDAIKSVLADKGVNVDSNTPDEELDHLLKRTQKTSKLYRNLYYAQEGGSAERGIVQDNLVNKTGIKKDMWITKSISPKTASATSKFAQKYGKLIDGSAGENMGDSATYDMGTHYLNIEHTSHDSTITMAKKPAQQQQAQQSRPEAPQSNREVDMYQAPRVPGAKQFRQDFKQLLSKLDNQKIQHRYHKSSETFSLGGTKERAAHFTSPGKETKGSIEIHDGKGNVTWLRNFDKDSIANYLNGTTDDIDGAKWERSLFAGKPSSWGMRRED